MLNNDFLIPQNFAHYIVPKTRHINMQSRNKFGSPLTLGLKIIPKVISFHNQIEIIKGFELILHSELWICNLTSLPVTFGAPSSQFFSKNKENHTLRNSNKRMTNMLNAENALLELSSILEFGDKGHSFTNESNENFSDREVLMIPNQLNDEIVGEFPSLFKSNSLLFLFFSSSMSWLFHRRNI